MKRFINVHIISQHLSTEASLVLLFTIHYVPSFSLSCGRHSSGCAQASATAHDIAQTFIPMYMHTHRSQGTEMKRETAGPMVCKPFPWKVQLHSMPTHIPTQRSAWDPHVHHYTADQMQALYVSGVRKRSLVRGD